MAQEAQEARILDSGFLRRSHASGDFLRLEKKPAEELRGAIVDHSEEVARRSHYRRCRRSRPMVVVLVRAAEASSRRSLNARFALLKFVFFLS